MIFSGLKIDKLDDLEAMINRGKIIARVLGRFACDGAAQSGGCSSTARIFVWAWPRIRLARRKPYYIPPERIEQAKRMLTSGREKGIKFVLPVDWVIQDGSVVDKLKPGDQQFDIGPKTSELFEREVGEFLEIDGAVAFHNGVFGMFEDSRFEEGTKRFIPQLKRMTDNGVEVYIGGGEGGAALEKYGEESWVTHVFTAGGTVLNALGGEPVPFLVALRMAAGRSKSD